MGDWLHSEFVETGKLPLMLCFAAFIVTFAVTRLITRMIRAGKGPFRDQETEGGIHIHHMVPGIVVLATGAVMAVGAAHVPWRSIAGVAVGIGLSLVLDEFALILHMEDVYWSREGRLSVSLIVLTAAFIGLALIGATPLGLENISQAEANSRVGATIGILWHGAAAVITVAKGKYRIAPFALFIPVVGLFTAIRLARPGSWWAKRNYRGDKVRRAAERAERVDRRWQPLIVGWENLIGGKPSESSPQRP